MHTGPAAGVDCVCSVGCLVYDALTAETILRELVANPHTRFVLGPNFTSVNATEQGNNATAYFCSYKNLTYSRSLDRKSGVFLYLNLILT